MLDKNNFKIPMGSWFNKLEPLFENGVMEEIYAKLKERGSKGVKIAPLSTDTFKAFEYTKFEDLKLVICGICPYHTFTKEGLPIADGVCMSSRHQSKPQPSLDKFYSEIERVYEYENMKRLTDLKYLAEQGILMLNAALTVEKDKALSMNKLWEPFTKYLFEEVISITGVPVIFLGKESHKFSKFLAPMQWNFQLSHPASAAYNHTDWNSEGVFNKIDRIIKDANRETIEWNIDNILPF